ncbi:hypothetical protein B0A49_07864 [Cryomyces minteri]|uniref:Het-C-domain-containing protein n=2 Tax=Cryomyces minteri TaxID=331657 RepID=A0A4U0WL12_9PEZI|nr:hypothetical protein B0A49_07864 [Cryomyces minteri]
MAYSRPSISLLLPCLILIVLLARPSYAFGAGNIASTAKIEGQNWRHGDIEDTLLTLLMSRAAGGKKFSKMDVKRVYFGNWLRDYSQAVDVGTVKYVSAEAIRILLWVLGFMSFGYGTKEFEVTTQRLGCYRPEEHIDNPKDYADNIDARQYDRRLRGPIDERRELSIDERTGLKHYIASEDRGITTSAGLVRNLFGRSIQLGRQYARSGNKADLYEALRLLGTGCHCLEDYSAHSNYTELALIELGEHGVFPHVGRRTQVRLQGARQPVYPIVTGTFGGVDFLHSVMGEFSDKATQTELQELEGTIQGSTNQDTSILKNLLNQLPSGLFGVADQAGKADELQANAAAAQMQNMNITPKRPEAFTQQLDMITKQIYPVMEFHDQIMQSLTETIENIPILPELIEQITDQINIFVFSLLAPFVLPIIKQVKTELNTGSSEIIESSREKQHIVFHDDSSSDPTHSMLSKDHFSNILNEPAGKVASQVLKWVVPQLIACWDDERIDVNRTLNRIVTGVFHHPALANYGDDGARDGRQLMFGVVAQWWQEKSQREKNDLRDKLSREGVENGRNHKEGVHDSGHGCGGLSQALGGQSQSGYGARPSSGRPSPGFDQVGSMAGEAIGGGVLGSVVGGLVGGVGATLLGSAFEGAKTQHYQNQGYTQDGSYTQSYAETGHRPAVQGQPERYGQAEYKQTQYPSGGRREEYQRFEQDGRTGQAGYGFEQSVETRPTHGGGYEQTTERRYEKPGGRWESEVQTEGVRPGGQHYAHGSKHHGSEYGKEDSDDGDDDDDEDDEVKRDRKERKRREKEDKRRHKKGKSYGEQEDSDDEKKNRHSGGGYGGGSSGNQDYYYERQQREERERLESGHSHHERKHSPRREEHVSGYAAERKHSPRRDEYAGGYAAERPSSRGSGGARRLGGFEDERAQAGYGSAGYERERPVYGAGAGSDRERPAYGAGLDREQPAYGGRAGFQGRAAGYGEPQEERVPGAFGAEDEYEEEPRQQYGNQGGGYGRGW